MHPTVAAALGALAGTIAFVALSPTFARSRGGMFVGLSLPIAGAWGGTHLAMRNTLCVGATLGSGTYTTPGSEAYPRLY